VAWPWHERGLRGEKPAGNRLCTATTVILSWGKEINSLIVRLPKCTCYFPTLLKLKLSHYTL
jgi:hypothetical protein